MPQVLLSPFFTTTTLSFLKMIAVELNRRNAGREFECFTKEDDSPVTSADYWASQEWCTFLSSQFPHDSIVSEENNRAICGSSGRTWFVDPIDGTRQFIDQSSDFYSLAGVIENGKPLFGIHLNPRRGTVLAGGKGFGVFFFDLNSGEVTPITRRQRFNSYFHLKGLKPEVRNGFYHTHGFSKPPFPSRQVHMLCPLMEDYAGFATFRPTWNWDLAAPAAIALAAGYEVAMASMSGETFFNVDIPRCASLICIPPETSASVKKDLKSFTNVEMHA